MFKISRVRKIVLVCVVIFFIAVIESTLTASWMVEQMSTRIYSSVNSIPSRKAGIILGAPEYCQGRPNPVFAGRIQAATELYHAGKIQTVVVSGLSRPNEFYDEVSAMSKGLIASGIPKDAIIEDNKGFRTLDSILRMHDVFGYNDFIIITQRDHCERALFLAKHHNISSIGFEARILSGQSIDIILESSIRESLARVKAIIDIAINRHAKYPVE